MSKYSSVRDRAEKVSKMIVARARVTAKEAGLDPTMPFLMAHNAMVSYEYGNPWKGLDYSKVRKVLWLEQLSWKPERLAESWAKRQDYRTLFS